MKRMKSEYIWCILVCAAVLIAAVVGAICFHNWWHSPGIKILGSKVNLDIKENAYLIDEFAGEILGQTSVIIVGKVEKGQKGTDGDVFEGYIHVDGYEIPYRYTAEPYVRVQKPYIDIHYASGYRQMINGEAVAKDGEYNYDVYMDTREPARVIVHVTENDTGHRVYAICAGTQEQACTILNDYNTERYGEEYPAVG